MREGKFRAWDDREKRYILPREIDIQRIPTTTTKYGFKLRTRFILEQFTGLKDQNHKECYHKDIYKRSDGQIGAIQNFIEDTYHLLQWIRDGGEFEIIGNINKSPELLSTGG